MFLEIVHTTNLTYDRPVTETMMELRLRPSDDEMQRTHVFELEVEPRGNISISRDAYANAVSHYNHRPSLGRVGVVGHSIVETGLGQTTSSSPLMRFQFLGFSGPVVVLPEVQDLAGRLRPLSSEDPVAVERSVAELTQYVYGRFRYQTGVTTVQSTIADLVRHGEGVCQDFAHYWLAVCRAMGIAARYVSGYVHRDSAAVGSETVASESHAWGEAWIPGRGWCGYDPTNPLEVTPFHVKLAVGRDYRDVPPTKGIFIGPATETVSVAVRTRQLPALPPVVATKN